MKKITKKEHLENQMKLWKINDKFACKIIIWEHCIECSMYIYTGDSWLWQDISHYFKTFKDLNEFLKETYCHD